jgi:surfeit locus 1 family protein
MKRSTLVFVVIAVIAAAVCVRLGIWQLSRREQRRAMNARISARISQTPIDVRAIPHDTTQSRFATARVVGRPDFEREILLTLRGNNGAPGVDILTPVRIAGTDTAVLVNRGWVYSPDGVHIEMSRWRETDTVFTGYVDSFVSAPGDSVRDGGVRRASYEAISRVLPYPILPFYVTALGDTTAVAPDPRSAPRIVRLQPPKLGEGPHLSYAFQWFGFALISLVGAGIVAARSMQSGRSSRTQ